MFLSVGCSCSSGRGECVTAIQTPHIPRSKSTQTQPFLRIIATPQLFTEARAHQMLHFFSVLPAPSLCRQHEGGANPAAGPSKTLPALLWAICGSKFKGIAATGKAASLSAAAFALHSVFVTSLGTNFPPTPSPPPLSLLSHALQACHSNKILTRGSKR